MKRFCRCTFEFVGNSDEGTIYGQTKIQKSEDDGPAGGGHPCFGFLLSFLIA